MTDIQITEIDGIGQGYATILAGAGIETVQDLLDTAGSAEGQTLLSEATSIPRRKIVRWYSVGNFLRIEGLNSDYGDLLYRSGTTTLPALAEKDPSTILAEIQALTSLRLRKENLPPDQEMIVGWQQAAQKQVKEVTFPGESIIDYSLRSHYGELKDLIEEAVESSNYPRLLNLSSILRGQAWSQMALSRSSHRLKYNTGMAILSGMMRTVARVHLEKSRSAIQEIETDPDFLLSGDRNTSFRLSTLSEALEVDAKALRVPMFARDFDELQVLAGQMIFQYDSLLEEVLRTLRTTLNPRTKLSQGYLINRLLGAKILETIQVQYGFAWYLLFALKSRNPQAELAHHFEQAQHLTIESDSIVSDSVTVKDVLDGTEELSGSVVRVMGCFHRIWDVQAQKFSYALEDTTDKIAVKFDTDPHIPDAYHLSVCILEGKVMMVDGEVYLDASGLKPEREKEPPLATDWDTHLQQFFTTWSPQYLPVAFCALDTYLHVDEVIRYRFHHL